MGTRGASQVMSGVEVVGIVGGSFTGVLKGSGQKSGNNLRR